MSNPNNMAAEYVGAINAPLIPAKVPQNAAWPRRRSKHVDTNNVIADDANTGEYPLFTCKYHVARVDRMVTPNRVNVSMEIQKILQEDPWPLAI